MCFYVWHDCLGCSTDILNVPGDTTVDDDASKVNLFAMLSIFSCTVCLIGIT